ncbi:MAG: LLM class flavin-dependent oxidoreductase, partial [Candidatus Kariarchaeaceae archaeon]
VTPVSFRNFGPFAKLMSTVDHISNGRITLGLGTGWHAQEHKMFDIDYPNIQSRYTLLEDTIRALIKLWTSDKAINFQSESIKLSGAYLNPKPVQKPHPPILIGGGGEKRTLKLVAKYAQMSNFGGNNETIFHKLSILENHCDQIGRNFNEIEPTTNMAAIIGSNDEEVNLGIRKYRKRFQELGILPPPMDTFDKNRLVGTPEQIIGRIEELSSLGIRSINITINDSQSEKYLEKIVE